MFDIDKELENIGLNRESYKGLLQLCSDKVAKVNDLDWSEISNKYSLGLAPDTCRKAQQPPILGAAFVRQFYEEEISKSNTSLDEDEYFKKLRVEKQEIQKEKQKLFDERTSLNKEIREQARRESMFDIVKRAIDEYQYEKFEYSPVIISDSDNDLIIHLTDVHCGVDIDCIFNEFNTNILKHRLMNFLDEIIDIKNTYKSQNAYLIIGGDLIQGLIHTNARIEAKENIVMQIMKVTDLISDFINELSKMFQTVEVHSTAGNHARSTANKEETPKGENFDLLVPYACKKDLKNVSNVKFVDNMLDCDIATFKVRGHMIYASHGDKDTPSNVVYNMTKFARKSNLPLPDMCYLGHRHTNGLTTVDDVKVVESGCVDGMDSYSIDKRLVGTPEQTVTVVTEKRLIKALCDIQLD